MKKILFSLMVAIAAIGGLRAEVAGQYAGQLNIGGDDVEGESTILIFPGSDASHVNFVLPDFEFSGLPLGDIVLINVPCSASGELSLAGYPLYMSLLQERVAIDINSGSAVAADGSVQINLGIHVPSLAESLASIGMESLPVTFTGARQAATDYQLRNAGFEEWETEEVNKSGSSYTGLEPTHWNSFIACDFTITGIEGALGKPKAVVSSKLVQGTAHTGNYSALIKSSVVLSVKANGNLTTGRIHAGSSTASDATKNYNYTDADNDRFRAPFVGHPDAISLWIKNQPVSGSNSTYGSVKAIIHSSGDYKDPAQTADEALEVGIAQNAEIGTLSDFTKLTIPFTYAHNGQDVNGNDPAFLLLNITTNAVPGGGNASGDNVDQMWVDDISLVYNSTLSSLTVGGTAVNFGSGTTATLATAYNDETLTVEPVLSSSYASSYVGFDPYNSQVVVIVKGEDFAQDASSFHTYTIGMAPVLSVEEELTLQQYKHKQLPLSINGIEAADKMTWEATDPTIVSAASGLLTAGKQLGDASVIVYLDELGTEIAVHVVEQPALTVSEALALCSTLAEGSMLPDGKFVVRGYLQSASDGSSFVLGAAAPASQAAMRAPAASSEVISIPSAEVLNTAGNGPSAAGQRVEAVGELIRNTDGSISMTDASVLGIDERGWATATEDASAQQVRKLLIDGQMIILRDGRAYNALGQSIR